MSASGGRKQQVMLTVREGMAVVDASGETIGEVALIYLGERARAVAQEPASLAAILAQEADEDGIYHRVIQRISNDLRIDPPTREALFAGGFLVIDASHVSAAPRYAMPRHIQSVVQDSVLLNVSGGLLPKA